MERGNFPMGILPMEESLEKGNNMESLQLHTGIPPMGILPKTFDVESASIKNLQYVAVSLQHAISPKRREVRTLIPLQFCR